MTANRPSGDGDARGTGRADGKEDGAAAAGRAAPSEPDGRRRAAPAPEGGGDAGGRVAASLRQVAATLRAQRRDLVLANCDEALLAAELRIEGIARAEEMTGGRGAVVSLGAFLDDLGGRLGAALGIEVLTRCEPVPVSGRMAAQIAIIVGELVLRAAGRTHAGGGDGPVIVAGGRRGSTLRVTVTAADRGSGHAGGSDPGGAGADAEASVIGAALERIGGEMHVRMDGGAVFAIEAPLA